MPDTLSMSIFEINIQIFYISIGHVLGEIDAHAPNPDSSDLPCAVTSASNAMRFVKGD